MTDKQLEKFGLYKDNSLSKNSYWSNVTQCCLTINNNCNPEDILQIVFETGFSEGIHEGEKRRSKEIRDLLNQ